MIYNFRFDRDSRCEVLRRVKDESFLCQGWGGGEEGDLNLEREDYTESCQVRYKLASTKIPTNLSRIRKFQDGDLPVVPHLPENGKVSVHVVDGTFPNCYVYLGSDSWHLNNQIVASEQPNQSKGVVWSR